MNLVVLGLSITSAWGNGHATTWRSLLRATAEAGHDVTFLERDVPWYADHRDLARPGFCTTHLYGDLDELERHHGQLVRDADAVILGSFVPDGIAVGRWLLETARGVRAFYDIDTPVTLAALTTGTCTYLEAALIPAFDLYLSFSGGRSLERLRHEFGAREAAALYCAVDEELYRPLAVSQRYDLGYLGTYAADRQDTLERLLVDPARRLAGRRFAVAGAQYPDDLDWPANVERLSHVPPGAHAGFYAAQRFTLNVTRRDMVLAGHSPSVRLFEAAMCGVPIISDWWDGLDELFRPGTEILIARGEDDVIRTLEQMPEAERARLAAAARRRVQAEHTGRVRARELEALLVQAHAAIIATRNPRSTAGVR